MADIDCQNEIRITVFALHPVTRRQSRMDDSVHNVVLTIRFRVGRAG
ncbi:hypothetical Protein YC6258_00494 [Gynuella sunshinyii YC6258]|uniref:Uncharacterized protein n=1 Tax=Gynuella sunshinyii YC6258 TaxID=1445510 RepID=A0A0C5VQJ5_9GAMM|nr:hypothetical Protein YC6258_00494 [Gynuella sunshinyii YC6258]